MIHKMKRVSSNLVLLNRKLSDTKLSTLENICAVTPPKNKLHQHQLSYQNCQEKVRNGEKDKSYYENRFAEIKPRRISLDKHEISLNLLQNKQN